MQYLDLKVAISLIPRSWHAFFFDLKILRHPPDPPSAAASQGSHYGPLVADFIVHRKAWDVVVDGLIASPNAWWVRHQTAPKHSSSVTRLLNLIPESFRVSRFSRVSRKQRCFPQMDTWNGELLVLLVLLVSLWVLALALLLGGRQNWVRGPALGVALGETGGPFLRHWWLNMDLRWVFPWCSYGFRSLHLRNP